MVKELEFIAEIGINHNGSLSLAKDHVLAAKKSGATIAKFQTYFTESRPYKRPELTEILKSCELSIDSFRELSKYCNSLGIKFCSTPFCEKSADLLDEINCEIIKIASFHMNNFELIDKVLKSRSCKTIIISTGLSSLPQINKLNDFIAANNVQNLKIIYLHCVSQYPIQDIKHLNLRNISYLSNLSACSAFGYSDHSLGTTAAAYSVILGSSYIEKHFSVDPNLPGADHSMSASPDTFKKMVEECNNALTSLGNIRSEDRFFNYEIDSLEFQKITDRPC